MSGTRVEVIPIVTVAMGVGGGGGGEGVTQSNLQGWLIASKNEKPKTSCHKN